MQDHECFTGQGNEEMINHYRLIRGQRFARMHKFETNYTIDLFLEDLDLYFEHEVDFNFEKIRQVIQAPGMLEKLVKQAIEEKTHPVSVFLQVIFKETSK